MISNTHFMVLVFPREDQRIEPDVLLVPYNKYPREEMVAKFEVDFNKAMVDAKTARPEEWDVNDVYIRLKMLGWRFDSMACSLKLSY